MLIDEAKLVDAFGNADADVCADYGDYAEFGYSLARVRETVDIAKSAGIPEQDCYIVLHRNYADGSYARAYWSADAAYKAVEDECQRISVMLQDTHYECRILKIGNDHTEVYAPDRDIYYEWDVVFSTIE